MCPGSGCHVIRSVERSQGMRCESEGDNEINALINVLIKVDLLKDDLDYHLIRASMVVTFLFFGYQKWFEYEAQVLIPYISNGPLIFWMYPVFGSRGAPRQGAGHRVAVRRLWAGRAGARGGVPGLPGSHGPAAPPGRGCVRTAEQDSRSG